MKTDCPASLMFRLSNELIGKECDENFASESLLPVMNTIASS